MFIAFSWLTSRVSRSIVRFRSNLSSGLVPSQFPRQQELDKLKSLVSDQVVGTFDFDFATIDKKLLLRVKKKHHDIAEISTTTEVQRLSISQDNP